MLAVVTGFPPGNGASVARKKTNRPPDQGSLISVTRKGPLTPKSAGSKVCRIELDANPEQFGFAKNPASTNDGSVACVIVITDAAAVPTLIANKAEIAATAATILLTSDPLPRR